MFAASIKYPRKTNIRTNRIATIEKMKMYNIKLILGSIGLVKYWLEHIGTSEESLGDLDFFDIFSFFFTDL